MSIKLSTMQRLQAINPRTLHFQNTFDFLGTFAVISYSSPYTTIACVPLLVGVMFLRNFSLKAIRSLKRIEAVSELNADSCDAQKTSSRCFLFLPEFSISRVQESPEGGNPNSTITPAIRLQGPEPVLLCCFQQPTFFSLQKKAPPILTCPLVLMEWK